MTKLAEKDRAIVLRRQGFSYSQILREVPVYKSTLSLWFREVKLSKRQYQRLTERKMAAALRGAQQRHKQRLDISEQIKQEAKKEISQLTENTFRVFGAALYWAEGSKQKEHIVSVGVIFTNSDPGMVYFFYHWLIKICHIYYCVTGLENFMRRVVCPRSSLMERSWILKACSSRVVSFMVAGGWSGFCWAGAWG